MTNEDTNNTPGRACRRPKPHKPSAPVYVRPIIDAVDGTVNNPGAVYCQRGSRLASGVALGTRPRREFRVQIQHRVLRSSP